MTDDEPSDSGILEARELMEKFNVKPHQLIEEAYVDLLARRRSNPRCGSEQTSSASGVRVI